MPMKNFDHTLLLFSIPMKKFDHKIAIVFNTYEKF